MSDDGWRAPGRANGSRPEPGEPYAPAPAAQVPPRGGPYGPPSEPAPTGSQADAFATSDRHRDRVLGGPGYDSPAYRNDSSAVMAMVFGVIGILVPGVSLLAIAFGHLARRRLRTSYEGGRGLAVAGLAMGYAMTAVWLALFLLFLSVRTML